MSDADASQSFNQYLMQILLNHLINVRGRCFLIIQSMSDADASQSFNHYWMPMLLSLIGIADGLDATNPGDVGGEGAIVRLRPLSAQHHVPAQDQPRSQTCTLIENITDDANALL